ncbi:response regulator [Paenibacillus macerans]|uniref:Response regulator n=2 Tax=Paenibacillus TaxID=44249 RepID=A0A6N8EQQ0_PAEMA|nr:response regulator [Paenibacillus macerans]
MGTGASEKRRVFMTKQIHVVVIDNQPAVSAGIKIILEEDTSIKVIGSAKNGKDGLKLIEQLNPSVVLLELKLPDGSGLKLLRHIKEQFPAINTIIYTGYDFEPFLNEIIESGVSGVMNKNASTKEIHQLIRNVINGYTMIPLTIFSRMRIHRSPEVQHYWEIDLTDSEKRIVSLIAQKYTNVKIASETNVSESSVENHLKKLYNKLGVNSKAEAFNKITRENRILALKDI